MQGAIPIPHCNETYRKEINWRQAIIHWERQPIESTILKIKLNILAIQMARTISQIKFKLWKKFAVQGVKTILSLNETDRKEINWSHWEKQPVETTIQKIKLTILAG